MPTTISFDSPAPPGVSNDPIGIYQGIDFGNRWRWMAPGPLTVPMVTNGIHFDGVEPPPAVRTFTFVPAPRLLISLVVIAWNPGSLTLTDDLGQTASLTMAGGALGTLVTGWTQPSTTVTVTVNGWNFGVDDITVGP
jgi:hypothetical protein